MKTYILDSFAMLAYFRDEKGANEVEDLLVGAAEGKHLLMMTAINAGEVYYMSVRKDGKIIAEKVWEALSNFPINIIPADLDFALQSAKIKAEHKLSYADAFAAALSIRVNGELVSGDKEFLNLSALPGFKMKLIPN
jgi:predicted nucleic acid-binding protein